MHAKPATPPDLFRSLPADELAALPRLTEDEIRAALERGRLARANAELTLRQLAPLSRVRFR